MTVIGFHASHEQVHPGVLLDAVRAAEQAGFDTAMCSDHFAPWSERQGHSGYAWSWLGAALATTSLPFGVVTAPGQRYHPAVAAQKIATLAAMFPGRFWAALGSGEALNEHITGDRWPEKDVRNARLLECVDVMRRLLGGEELSHHGLVTVDRARIWTLPDEPPRLLAAAVSASTARWAAGWADGLITVNGPADRLRAVIDAYRGAGGRGNVALQVHLSYATNDAEAAAIATDQWRTNVFDARVSWDLELVQQFDSIAEHVQPDDVRRSVLVSSDTAQHAAWLHDLASIGFDELYLHHVGQTQCAFIEAFASEVLPQLKGRSR
jgi:probable non-F420 flavinoid oxidoreductase